MPHRTNPIGRWIVVLFIIVLLHAGHGRLEGGTGPFEDGSRLVLDTSKAASLGVHEVYLETPGKERRLLWSHTFYARKTRYETVPYSMGMNGIHDAFRQGDSYALLINRIEGGSFYFLKIDGATSPPAWSFGTVGFPYPPGFAVGISGVPELHWTGIDTFTGKVPGSPLHEYRIAGSGELFLDGKPTGTGADLINGKPVRTKEAYQTAMGAWDIKTIALNAVKGALPAGEGKLSIGERMELRRELLAVEAGALREIESLVRRAYLTRDRELLSLCIAKEHLLGPLLSLHASEKDPKYFDHVLATLLRAGPQTWHDGDSGFGIRHPALLLGTHCNESLKLRLSEEIRGKHPLDREANRIQLAALLEPVTAPEPVEDGIPVKSSAPLPTPAQLTPKRPDSVESAKQPANPSVEAAGHGKNWPLWTAVVVIVLAAAGWYVPRLNKR